MIRRIFLIVLVIVVAYFAYGEIKDFAVDYYVDHHYVRTTATPATQTPDQVALTWSGDPATSMAINWRTAPSVEEGWVVYRPADATEAEPQTVDGEFAVIEDHLLENDTVNHRFTAELQGLEPDTRYAYRVGAPGDRWTDWWEFTTAPGETEPFSFMYLGDPQQGLDEWGELVQLSYQRHPDSAFYIIAGDLVNDGDWRNEWDEFFAGSAGVFDRVPVVPSLGNHDVDDALQAELYIESFALPENGPVGVDPERAFYYTYGNALFIVLDSNLPADTQTAWLEKVLSESDATWKFALYHHPFYVSRRARDNAEIRDAWGPLFDKFGVDIAFQGHDHAYLRTHPMRAGMRAAADGTIYIISVSGTKFYEQENHDYAAVAFPETMTYQHIQIDTNPDRLTYRAYDLSGKVRDEVILEK